MFFSYLSLLVTSLCILKMVPRAGLEPAQSFDHEILSLARMPISPPRLLNGKTVLWATVTKPVSVTGNGYV